MHRDGDAIVLSIDDRSGSVSARMNPRQIVKLCDDLLRTVLDRPGDERHDDRTWDVIDPGTDPHPTRRTGNRWRRDNQNRDPSKQRPGSDPHVMTHKVSARPVTTMLTTTALRPSVHTVDRALT